MILNLDAQFKPKSGEEIAFESFVFSGGEPHIRIQAFDTTKAVHLTHRIRSFNDLGLLVIAVDALKRMKVNSIHLILPYFPAARQDRIMTQGESLTVKVVADIINNLSLSSITIFDPHSDVTPALLDHCTEISNYAFITAVLKSLPNDFILVSPDAGAAKKVHKLARHLGKSEILECSKKRDVKTGALSEFVVPSQQLEGNPCLIVDDICDAGGTFLGLGEALKKKGAGELYLAVSHGIFSKGLDHLTEMFKMIFTTDSFRTMDNTDNFKQLKFDNALLS